MKKWITAIFLGAAVVLSGCSSIKKQGAEVEITPSKWVHITHVTVEQTNGTIRVNGTLHPESTAVTRTGHVDIVFRDTEGNILKEIRVKPSVSKFSRNSSRRPTFSASAQVGIVKSVQLAHHDDPLKQCDL